MIKKSNLTYGNTGEAYISSTSYKEWHRYYYAREKAVSAVANPLRVLYTIDSILRKTMSQMFQMTKESMRQFVARAEGKTAEDKARFENLFTNPARIVSRTDGMSDYKIFIPTKYKITVQKATPISTAPIEIGEYLVNFRYSRILAAMARNISLAIEERLRLRYAPEAILLAALQGPEVPLPTTPFDRAYVLNTMPLHGLDREYSIVMRWIKHLGTYQVGTGNKGFTHSIVSELKAWEEFVAKEFAPYTYSGEVDIPAGDVKKHTIEVPWNDKWVSLPQGYAKGIGNIYYDAAKATIACGKPVMSTATYSALSPELLVLMVNKLGEDIVIEPEEEMFSADPLDKLESANRYMYSFIYGSSRLMMLKSAGTFVKGAPKKRDVKGGDALNEMFTEMLVNIKHSLENNHSFNLCTEYYVPRKGNPVSAEINEYFSSNVGWNITDRPYFGHISGMPVTAPKELLYLTVNYKPLVGRSYKSEQVSHWAAVKTRPSDYMNKFFTVDPGPDKSRALFGYSDISDVVEEIATKHGFTANEIANNKKLVEKQLADYTNAKPFFFIQGFVHSGEDNPWGTSSEVMVNQFLTGKTYFPKGTKSELSAHHKSTKKGYLTHKPSANFSIMSGVTASYVRPFSLDNQWEISGTHTPKFFSHHSVQSVIDAQTESLISDVLNKKGVIPLVSIAPFWIGDSPVEHYTSWCNVAPATAMFLNAWSTFGDNNSWFPEASLGDVVSEPQFTGTSILTGAADAYVMLHPLTHMNITGNNGVKIVRDHFNLGVFSAQCHNPDALTIEVKQQNVGSSRGITYHNFTDVTDTNFYNSMIKHDAIIRALLMNRKPGTHHNSTGGRSQYNSLERLGIDTTKNWASWIGIPLNNNQPYSFHINGYELILHGYMAFVIARTQAISLEEALGVSIGMYGHNASNIFHAIMTIMSEVYETPQQYGKSALFTGFSSSLPPTTPKFKGGSQTNGSLTKAFGSLNGEETKVNNVVFESAIYGKRGITATEAELIANPLATMKAYIREPKSCRDRTLMVNRMYAPSSTSNYLESLWRQSIAVEHNAGDLVYCSPAVMYGPLVTKRTYSNDNGANKGVSYDTTDNHVYGPYVNEQDGSSIDSVIRGHGVSNGYEDGHIDPTNLPDYKFNLLSAPQHHSVSSFEYSSVGRQAFVYAEHRATDKKNRNNMFPCEEFQSFTMNNVVLWSYLKHEIDMLGADVIGKATTPMGMWLGHLALKDSMETHSNLAHGYRCVDINPYTIAVATYYTVGNYNALCSDEMVKMVDHIMSDRHGSNSKTSMFYEDVDISSAINLYAAYKKIYSHLDGLHAYDLAADILMSTYASIANNGKVIEDVKNNWALMGCVDMDFISKYKVSPTETPEQQVPEQDKDKAKPTTMQEDENQSPDSNCGENGKQDGNQGAPSQGQNHSDIVQAMAQSGDQGQGQEPSWANELDESKLEESASNAAGKVPDRAEREKLRKAGVQNYKSSIANFKMFAKLMATETKELYVPRANNEYVLPVPGMIDSEFVTTDDPGFFPDTLLESLHTDLAIMDHFIMPSNRRRTVLKKEDRNVAFVCMDISGSMNSNNVTINGETCHIFSVFSQIMREVFEKQVRNNDTILVPMLYTSDGLLFVFDESGTCSLSTKYGVHTPRDQFYATHVVNSLERFNSMLDRFARASTTGGTDFHNVFTNVVKPIMQQYIDMTDAENPQCWVFSDGSDNIKLNYNDLAVSNSTGETTIKFVSVLASNGGSGAAVKLTKKGVRSIVSKNEIPLKNVIKPNDEHYDMEGLNCEPQMLQVSNSCLLNISEHYYEIC